MGSAQNVKLLTVFLVMPRILLHVYTSMIVFLLYNAQRIIANYAPMMKVRELRIA